MAGCGFEKGSMNGNNKGVKKSDRVMIFLMKGIWWVFIEQMVGES